MPDPNHIAPPTRRELLRYAGGVTFLALASNSRGLFAAADPTLPVFTALPYIQPGNNSALISGRESQIVAWQTDRVNADFTLEYGNSKHFGKTAVVARSERVASAADSAHGVPSGYNYAAMLMNLDLSRRYYYRLRGNGQTIAEGEFSTRKKRGEKTRFVAFGDNASGSAGERAIAYQAYEARPDFIMNTGDNVYDHGENNEYVRRFFPVYNADKADITIGAPLIRSVPFYTVLANHDVAFSDGNHHGSVANFDTAPDALGYYTNLHLPLNGPETPAHPTPLVGAEDGIARFRSLAGARYPRMANYSFDYADIHFLCMDSNVYIDPTAPELLAWIAADLKAATAAWKFVVYHHPAFNVGNEHYREQHMRTLMPLFEAHSVDFVLNGHEHVYQRAMPMRFKPTDEAKVSPGHGGDRRIPGTFTRDETFDGKTKTKPDGPIHITTGAGGASLYDPGFDTDPSRWIHPDDNVAYVTKFISAQHSCTVFDVSATELTMTQIGERGDVLDRIRVTKAA